MLRAVIYELETMPNISAWVSVKDRLPKCGELVLIYVANLNKGKGAYTFDKCRKVDGKKDWEFYNRHNANFDVTHWMPLPQKPESEDNAEDGCMKEASKGERKEPESEDDAE
jgi:hypothetical protein